jgi:riboflavin kinase/FMN adenylyltransferase
LRLELLAAAGVDGIVVLEFNREFASMTAREFVERILLRGLNIRGLHEGANFRFGRNAEAGVGELADFGRACGFGLTVHEAVKVRGRLEVSSSAIRRLIAEGRVNQARWMLGRSFMIRGHQVRDRGVGGKAVVPTVNLGPYEGVVPAPGVYATRVRIHGRIHAAVTNCGNRPTFAEAGFAIESHLLNYEETGQGKAPVVEIEFLHRIREERRWPNPEALKAQIGKDVERAMRYFRRIRFF